MCISIWAWLPLTPKLVNIVDAPGVYWPYLDIHLFVVCIFRNSNQLKHCCTCYIHDYVVQVLFFIVAWCQKYKNRTTVDRSVLYIPSIEHINESVGKKKNKKILVSLCPIITFIAEPKIFCISLSPCSTPLSLLLVTCWFTILRETQKRSTVSWMV